MDVASPRRAVCLRKRATFLQDLGISILLSSAALKIYRPSFVLAYPWTLQLSPAESSCGAEQASFVNAIHVVSDMGASFGNMRFRLSTMRRFGNRRQSHARIFVAHLLNVWSRRMFIRNRSIFFRGARNFLAGPWHKHCLRVRDIENRQPFFRFELPMDVAMCRS